MQTGGREVRSMGEVSLYILAFMSVWMKAVVVRLRNGIDLVERRKVLSIVKMRCEERMARVFIERKRRGCGDSNANDGEERGASHQKFPRQNNISSSSALGLKTDRLHRLETCQQSLH